jgi:hypothetical protein
MFAQFFAAFFSYPFKTVYGKALPRMAVYCHFETAPFLCSDSGRAVNAGLLPQFIRHAGFHRRTGKSIFNPK